MNRELLFETEARKNLRSCGLPLALLGRSGALGGCAHLGATRRGSLAFALAGGNRRRSLVSR